MTRKLISTSLILMLAAAPAQSQIVINEIMQSNIDCIMDDTNEFPDSWVELYNTSPNQAYNLNTYRLGITTDPDKATHLPDRMLPPRQYAIVYCDKTADEGMHTSFRLESGKGCEVYLFREREIVDQLAGLKKQPAPNIAYGRLTDGADTWGYQAQPTPARANCGRIANEVLGNPVFSHTGRVVTDQQSFTLTVTLPKGTPEQAVVRFTLDGTEPTEQSPVFPQSMLINTTRVVRAKIFCDGYLSPPSTAHSYLFFPRQLTLPVVSIVTNNRYLNDPKIGIYVEGNYKSGTPNYQYDWRRPVNLEFFEAANKPAVINQLCETRIMGGATRSNPRKSLALYANKRFGEKRFQHEFFPDQRPGIDDFKSICLRNAGNDFDYLFMRDAVIQRSMAQHADIDWQAYRPAIVYVNGQYQGMLNIRERSNEDNIYSNYDGLEDLDMFENWWELKEGDWNNYNAFRDFYAQHGHTLGEFEQWMDCSEFANIMIMNLYFNNQDFPGNNIVMWRPRTNGGRWRWIAKDTDFGLGLYGTQPDYNTIAWIYTPDYDPAHNWANQYDHTRLFRRLMDNPDFNRLFIDRAAIYMGDFLNEQGVRAIWDPMVDAIQYEYPYHRQLINPWWPNYNDELKAARNWLSRRTQLFYRQLADHYRLGSPIPMRVAFADNNPGPAAPTIHFNGITLSNPLFDGNFFTGRNVTLTAQTADGTQVGQWTIQQIAPDGTATSTTVAGTTCTFTMPTCARLNVYAHTAPTGISSPATGEAGTTAPVKVFTASGHFLGQVADPCLLYRLPAAAAHHVLILRQGATTWKVVR